MRLSNESKKNIETITGLSLDIIERISLRSLEFYIQNIGKMSIEDCGGEFYFIIENRRLRRRINNALLRDRRNRKNSFLDGEIREYLIKSNYYGFPIDKNFRIDGLPVKSFSRNQTFSSFGFFIFFSPYSLK